MPLHKVISLSSNTKLYVWKITEDFNTLFSQVKLKDTTLTRLQSMKSESHQKGFLAVRMLLQHIGYSDFDLHYDEFGKPNLKPNECRTELVEVSISHSHNFSAIAISNQNIGIDLELQREKIIKIAHKFVTESFINLSDNNDNELIHKLTIIWGIKESIFKIRNEIGISFLDHVFVKPFEIHQNKAKAELHFNNLIKQYSIYFQEIENYTLVCAFEN